MLIDIKFPGESKADSFVIINTSNLTVDFNSSTPMLLNHAIYINFTFID